MTKPRGRPSTYTDEIAERICARLAEGESLADICRDDAMPGYRTVFQWLEKPEHAAFTQQYARAREIGDEKDADEIRAIADKKPEDQVEATWQKTRIDARKWLLAKRLPKKYGDRQQVEHTGKLTLEALVLGSLPGDGTET